MDTTRENFKMDSQEGALTYRKAVIGDIDLLAATRVEFYIGIHIELSDDEKEKFCEHNRAYFVESLADGSFFAYLAFDGDRLAATSGINFYSTPPTHKNPTGMMAYISNMYTKPDYRGRGIATRLLTMIIEEARRRGCGKITLSATDMGRPIYKKFGFTDADRDMNYHFSE